MTFDIFHWLLKANWITQNVFFYAEKSHIVLILTKHEAKNASSMRLYQKFGFLVNTLVWVVKKLEKEAQFEE